MLTLKNVLGSLIQFQLSIIYVDLGHQRLAFELVYANFKNACNLIPENLRYQNTLRDGVVIFEIRNAIFCSHKKSKYLPHLRYTAPDANTLKQALTSHSGLALIVAAGF